MAIVNNSEEINRGFTNINQYNINSGTLGSVSPDHKSVFNSINMHSLKSSNLQPISQDFLNNKINNIEKKVLKDEITNQASKQNHPFTEQQLKEQRLAILPPESRPQQRALAIAKAILPKIKHLPQTRLLDAARRGFNGTWDKPAGKAHRQADINILLKDGLQYI